jgi:hypothetical protein
MQISDRDVYVTDHIYVTAFLICSGHDVVDTRSEGTRVSFVFHNSAQLSADVASFLADGVIPARHFTFQLLKLKRMLHGGEYMNRSGKDENYKGFNSRT